VRARIRPSFISRAGRIGSSVSDAVRRKNRAHFEPWSAEEKIAGFAALIVRIVFVSATITRTSLRSFTDQCIPCIKRMRSFDSWIFRLFTSSYANGSDESAKYYFIMIILYFADIIYSTRMPASQVLGLLARDKRGRRVCQHCYSTTHLSNVAFALMYCSKRPLWNIMLETANIHVLYFLGRQSA